MSSVLKRQNHRIHPCNAARKNELLHHLIALYPSKSILVSTAQDTSALTVEPGANVTVIADADLPSTPVQKYDILISYDLPQKALVYMTRFAHAGEMALVLLSSDDQKLLYPIETLLGRTIIQETISGFEPDFGIAAEQKSKAEAKARRAERDEKNAKRDARPGREFKPRQDAERSDYSRNEKSDRERPRPSARGNKDAKPRFIGKDENGKPIFEGKTRERNHYIDGTPRTEAEKAYKTPYSSKPKFFGKDKPKSDHVKTSGDEKKPYDKKPYDSKKPFDKDKKPYEGKKSYGDREKKPYEGKKPYSNEDKKSFGNKKPYGEKKSFGDKKPYDKTAKSGKPASDYPKPASSDAAAPKRPPRRISVKSFKPSESKDQ